MISKKTPKAKLARKKLEVATILFIILGLGSFLLPINISINWNLKYDTPKTSANVDYEWSAVWSLDRHTDPRDITTDNLGNIYITGASSSSITNDDYFLMNINEKGNLNWSCIWGTQYYDSGKVILVNGSNFFILGYTNNSYEILKLNNRGIVTEKIHLDDTANSIFNDLKMDPLGNFYLGGVNKSQNYDINISKLNNTGHIQWEDTWNGGYNDYCYSIALDDNNNIFSLGKSYNYDYSRASLILFKHNNTGNLEWNTIWGSFRYLNLNKITVDYLGNIYVVGSGRKTSEDDYDVILVKFSHSGIIQWNFSWGGHNYDYGKDLLVDSTGTIYLLGSTRSYGQGKSDMCLLKINSNGDILWEYFWGGNSDDYGGAITIDYNGNIFVTGTTRSYGDEYTNLYLLKMGIDSDEDGLSDNNEDLLYFTDKSDPDTDNDRIVDGDEINIYHTNPLKSDTDGDLISDYDEIFIFHTDPNNAFNNTYVLIIIFSVIGIISVPIYYLINTRKRELLKNEK